MSDLLEDVIAAHGGLDRWKAFSTMRATIVTGGALWGTKGLVQDPNPREMKIWLHEERASVTPYGSPSQRTDFTPQRIAIETLAGNVVAERLHPRNSFNGHTEATPWDALHRAYFNGYALWTYLTTPFLLKFPGVSVVELGPYTDGGEVWRRLRAHFPIDIATHSAEQDFYFDRDCMLKRHDYSVDVVNGFAAAQYVSNYVEADGIRMPTKRRTFKRGPDGKAIEVPLMVSLDIGNAHYE